MEGGGGVGCGGGVNSFLCRVFVLLQFSSSPEGTCLPSHRSMNGSSLSGWGSFESALLQ